MKSGRVGDGGARRSFDPEAVQEVDLRPFFRALRRMWWSVVAGSVLGGAIGYGLAAGHGQTFSATATLYLGLPYGGGDVALQSAQTNPSTLGLIVHSAEIDARVARACRTPSSTFSGGIFTQQVAGTSGRNLQNAYVTLTVLARRAKVDRCAANELARMVVAVLSRYANGKLDEYRAELANDVFAIKAAEAAPKRASTRAFGSLVSEMRLFALRRDRSNLLSLVRQTIQLERPKQIGRAKAARVTARTATSSVFVAALLGAILSTIAIAISVVRATRKSSAGGLQQRA